MTVTRRPAWARMAVVALVGMTAWGMSACKGDAGPTGPKGDTGAQGTQGPPGPPGTANVLYSPWTSFNGAAWTLAMEFGKNVEHYDIAAAGVTSAILNNGVVLVYGRFSGAPAPFQMPAIFWNITQSANQELAFKLTAGHITIWFFNIDNINDPGTYGGTGNDYRYIIIPGGAPAPSAPAGNVASSVDWTKLSYDEVVQRLGIPR